MISLALADREESAETVEPESLPDEEKSEE